VRDLRHWQSRQKNLPKNTGGPVTTLEESRPYLDCSSFKDSKTMKVTAVWRLIVFYPSELKISDIFKTISDMVEPTLEKLNHFIQLKMAQSTCAWIMQGEID
jgi:hypothetical protein